MKKAFSLFVAVLAFSAVSFAQKGIVKFAKSENDFGKIEQGKPVSYVFEFTNTGDAPLVIKDVRSTCGCTVPTKPTEPIMPGKTGKIDVKYNMNPGPIRKTITVESNAVNVEDGRVALKIKGEVVVKEETSPLEKKKTSPMQ